MLCAKHVGRVGALAVALGVGVAVATTPGVAWAEEPDSSSESNAQPAAAGPSTAPAPGTSPPAEKTRRGLNSARHSAGTKETTSLDEFSVSVRSSGGNLSSREYEEDAIEEGEDAGDEQVDADPVTLDPTPPAATQDPPRRAPAPAKAPDSGARPSVAKTPVLKTNSLGPVTVGRHTNSPGAQRTTARRAATTTDDDGSGAESNLRASTFSAVEDAAPLASPAASLLGIPGTFINLATSLVAAALAPFIGPGPDSPAGSPVLLAVLAWVRRQFDQNLLNDTPVLVDNQDSEQIDEDTVEGSVTVDDADNANHTYTTSGGADGAVITVDDHGNWSYTAPAGTPTDQPFEDSFDVTVSDAGDGNHIHGLFGFVKPDAGHTDTITINVTVTSEEDQNLPPEIEHVIQRPTVQQNGNVDTSFRVAGDGAYESVVVLPGRYFTVESQSFNPVTGIVTASFKPTQALLLRVGQELETEDSFGIVAVPADNAASQTFSTFALRADPAMFAALAAPADPTVPLPLPPGATIEIDEDAIAVGDSPVGIVATKRYLYVMNYVENGTVTVIGADPAHPADYNQVIDVDPSTAEVDPIVVGSSPVLGTLIGDRLYVVDSAAWSMGDPAAVGSVTVIDTDPLHPTTVNTVIDSITIPTGAIGPTANPLGTRLYITSTSGVYVINIDPITGAADHNVVGPIQVTPPPPDPTDDQSVFYSAAGVGSFNVDGSRLYIPRQKITYTYNDDHTALISATQTGDIVVIDTASNTVVDGDLSTPAIDPIPFGMAPGLSVSTGGRLYLTSLDLGVIDPSQPPDPASFRGYVTVIDIGDPTSPTYQKIVDVDPDTPDTQRIPVGGYPINMALSPDGSVAYVVNMLDGTVTVIDTIANEEITTFTYDETPPTLTGGQFGPNVIAISPDGNHLYISRYGEDTVMTLSIVPVVPVVPIV